MQQSFWTLYYFLFSDLRITKAAILDTMLILPRSVPPRCIRLYRVAPTSAAKPASRSCSRPPQPRGFLAENQSNF